MLRTLLVGFDATSDSEPACELALRWASRFGALVAGCAVVDEPGARVSEAALIGEGFYGPADAALVDGLRVSARETLDRFRRRCQEVGVRYQLLLDAGVPHVQLAAESHRFDLLLLGRHTHFEFGHRKADDATLARVVVESPRPIVSVARVPENESDGPVLIAYDGSVRASRALSDLVASGLGSGRELHVISVDRDPDVAARFSQRALDFLAHHDLPASAHPLDGSYPPKEAILGAIDQLGVALLVIGAYGHKPLHGLLLGSTTRTLLEQTDIPVFCSH